MKAWSMFLAGVVLCCDLTMEGRLSADDAPAEATDTAFVIFEKKLELANKKKATVKIMVVNVADKPGVAVFHNYDMVLNKTVKQWFWLPVPSKAPTDSPVVTYDLIPDKVILPAGNEFYSLLNAGDRTRIEQTISNLKIALGDTARRYTTRQSAAKYDVMQRKILVQPSPSFVVSTDVVDLTKPPFTGNSAVPSPFRIDPATHQVVVTGDNVERAARWILSNYSANNPTEGAKTGQESIGGAWLHVIPHHTPAQPGHPETVWIRFEPFYLSNAKVKAVTLDHSYGATELAKSVKLEIDFIQFVQYVLSFGSDDVAALPDSPAPTGVPTPVETIHTLSEGGAAIKPPPWYESPHPDFPSFSQDSAGLSASDSLTLTPGNEKGGWPALNISGGKYFDRSLYNVSVNPSWKLSDDMNLGVVAQKKLTQAGQYINDTSSVSAQATYTKEVSDEISVAFNETGGASQKSNTANGPAATKTDEYTGLSYFGLVYTPFIGPENPPSTGGPPVDPMVQLNYEQWIKPAESSQNDHSYTAAAGRLHCAADVPTTWVEGHDGAPEFFRFDSMLFGGGVMGVTPAADLFNGGNADVSGGSDGEIPSPMLRSYGTGKLSVYSLRPVKNGGTTGASSFANANLTVALPLLAFPFLNKDEADTLNRAFSSGTSDKPGLADTPADRRTISWVANYDDYFAFKPLFTCDAVWMGAPNKYADRNLAAMGGGGEFSVGFINFDILYEVTLHDSSHRPLSDNIIAQLSYDINF